MSAAPGLSSREAYETEASLLSVLYDNVGHEDGWTPFIEALTARYAGGKGAVAFHDPVLQQGNAGAAAGWEPVSVERYDAHYAETNPWLARVASRPVGQASISDSLLPRAALIKTEFYNDFLRPANLEAGVSVTIERDQTRHMIVSVLIPGTTADTDAHAVSRMQRLAPHLLRVLQLNRQIALLKLRADAAEASLRGQGSALLIVDERSRIIYLDQAAEQVIAEADGLKIIGNILTATHAGEASQLHRLIADAVSARSRIDTTPGGAMRVHRPSTRPPLELLIAPMAGATARSAPGRPAALIFLRDPDAKVILEEDRLRRLYDLTAAEARLMMALLSGDDRLDSIAERTAVSKETLRTHLKSIFQKTGTNSQLALVRLGLRGIAAFMK